MPTLADIYSAINTAQRKGGDFVRNPGSSLQQMLGYANDRARGLNEQTAAAAEQGINSPEFQQLSQTVGGAYNPVGMTVWHGSPHIFEKFDLSKMGTGEGAQAYGKGMYMAQNPEVAMGYRGSTSNFGLPDKDPAKGIATLIASRGEQGENMARQAYSNLGDALEPTIKKAKQAVQENSSIYKVDLPDTHIRRMIDWDEPLKNQPAPIRNLAKSLGIDLNDLGGDLIGQIGKGEQGKKILQEAGIPGIKYLDQSSRNSAGWHITPPDQTVSGKWMVKGSDYNSKGSHFDTEKEAKDFMKQKLGEATRNFVVFDPNHLTILERNSQPIK